MSKITILGDGGWGTAISCVACGNGHDVTLWGFDGAYLEVIARSRENSRYLPGVSLPEKIRFVSDIGIALDGAELVIEAIPTKYLRTTAGKARGLLPERVGIISLTKGVEQVTLARPSEILADAMGAVRIGVLSGPSHAEEVVRGLPASVTLASSDQALAEQAQAALMTSSFRIYTSADVVGVELGGALKNVIAVAAGIATGLGLGDNAMAALVTRGLAEITRLGVALGADPLTFAGLSGMGDLITTCTSPHGRNRAVGLAIGQGKTLAQILDEMEMVAEGVTTVVSARDLGRRVGVELPITEQVYRVLYEGKEAREAVTDLMSREGRSEQ